MATKEEIFEGVKEVLIEALALEPEEVTPEATLLEDLGAESIDLLDIIFNLEKKFSIKIDVRGDLIPEDMLNDPAYVVAGQGMLTQLGLDELRKRLPNANLDTFAKNPMVQNISKILTVNDLCYIVETKLQK